MEYIIVKYASVRTVYIDGEDNGPTGERLRVEEGTHTINPGDPVITHRSGAGRRSLARRASCR